MVMYNIKPLQVYVTNKQGTTKANRIKLYLIWVNSINIKVIILFPDILPYWQVMGISTS